MKYCFWLMGVTPHFSSTTEGTFQARPGVIFSPYTWNLEGKLRNLKRTPFKGIEPRFLLLCSCED
jgi:hypothetical protein